MEREGGTTAQAGREGERCDQLVKRVDVFPFFSLVDTTLQPPTPASGIRRHLWLAVDGYVVYAGNRTGGAQHRFWEHYVNHHGDDTF